MPNQTARLLRKGDIIQYTGAGPEPIEEVIREVVIVLRMANGETLTVDPTTEYLLIPKEEFKGLTPEELAEFERAQAVGPSIEGDTE